MVVKCHMRIEPKWKQYVLKPSLSSTVTPAVPGYLPSISFLAERLNSKPMVGVETVSLDTFESIIPEHTQAQKDLI